VVRFRVCSSRHALSSTPILQSTAVAFTLSECGGLDTAVCLPALPAALAHTVLFRPPARPANTKRCQGHRTPKE